MIKIPSQSQLFHLPPYPSPTPDPDPDSYPAPASAPDPAPATAPAPDLDPDTYLPHFQPRKRQNRINIIEDW